MAIRNFTDLEEVEIAKIYLAGHSTRAIARAYPIPDKTSIISALRRQGVKQRSPAERNRKYKLDNTVFDEIDTEAKAYWWGFIYADGSVSKRSLSVMLRYTDVEILEGLKKFLSCENPIKDRIAKCNGKIYPQVQLYITDKHMTERLRELGIVNSRTCFNSAIKHLPEHLERHWIRGYFDGDGTASKSVINRHIGFCGNKDTLTWIRDVFTLNARTYSETKIKKHTKAEIYYLLYFGKFNAHRAADFMYHDSDLFLKRKKFIIDKWK